MENEQVLKEVVFKLKRKGDFKRAVGKLVRRLRKTKRGSALLKKGRASIAVSKSRIETPDGRPDETEPR
jgi:hypothetical protein